MVLETVVHGSPRSRHMSKSLSFCTSTCLMSLAFVVVGAKPAFSVTVGQRDLIGSSDHILLNYGALGNLHKPQLSVVTSTNKDSMRYDGYRLPKTAYIRVIGLIQT